MIRYPLLNSIFLLVLAYHYLPRPVWDTSIAERRSFTQSKFDIMDGNLKSSARYIGPSFSGHLPPLTSGPHGYGVTRTELMHKRSSDLTDELLPFDDNQSEED